MRFRIPAVALAVALALVGCSSEQAPSKKPPEQNPPTELERDVAERIGAAVEAGFSGAILVRVGDQRISAGSGFADREQGIENDPATAFDVGSILKSFTALAIFQLVESGSLSLDSTLSELLPAVPADKAEISVLQVLTHQAGFDEYHDTEGDFEAMDRLEARQRILAQELRFEPGEDEAYSNSGYTLLADIVETVSGEAYTGYVHRHLFAPAGMRESGFYSEPVWQSVETAIGYDASIFQGNDPASWPYTWALVGNGGLVTTVGDLDRFLDALYGGALLEPATFALVESEFLAAGAARLGGETVYGEAGAGDYGLGGALIDAPDAGVRVIIATNTYEVFDIEMFAIELTEHVLELRGAEP